MGLRVAVIAGKSVGGAVQRNRAKRVMRAAIQPFLSEIKPDTDLLLIARPEILPTKSLQLQETLQALLRRAKLLK